MLRPGAPLRIANIDPWGMRDTWLFRYYPEAFPLDEARFWPATLLTFELEQLGFDVVVRGEYERRTTPLAEIRVDAVRADLSEFALMTDAARARGLARIDAELARDPAARAVTEHSLRFWTATRA